LHGSHLLIEFFDQLGLLLFFGFALEFHLGVQGSHGSSSLSLLLSLLLGLLLLEFLVVVVALFLDCKLVADRFFRGILNLGL